jgi:hypothetical protein
VLPPSANPTTGAVYPRQSSGFAAGVIGGFLALGILMLAMFLLNLKPKRVNRR